MTTSNQDLRKRAAFEHVVEARRTVAERAQEIGTVSNSELAILLGRVVRAVEEVSTKLDTLENVLVRILEEQQKK